MGLVACLVFLLAWLASGSLGWAVSYLKVDSTNPAWNLPPNSTRSADAYCRPDFYLVLAKGTFQLSCRFQKPVALDPGWRVFRLPDSTRTPWLPWLRNNSVALHTNLPLWIPLAMTLVVTAYLFWRDRPVPAHCCQKCGYNLTGNVSGRCPECGEKCETSVMNAAGTPL